MHVYAWPAPRTEDRQSCGGGIETAAAEAINNAVMHAYDGQAGSVIEMTAVADAADLVIEVSDRGHAMSRLPAAEVSAGDEPGERGRGWQVMRAWMDEVEYRTSEGKNTVRLRKRIASPAFTEDET
jgi:anti-sigma regulatory factor (Ser/Thr protein kinase)